MNTSKWIAATLIASLILPSVAFAENTVQPAPSSSVTIVAAPPKPSAEPDVGMTTAPLRKGDKAPFTGVLLSPGAAASIIADIKNHTALLGIEIDRTKKEDAAKCDFDKKNLTADFTADKKILQAQLDDQKTTIVGLQTDLKKAEDAAPNRVVWMGVGFVGGVIVTVLTVYAVSKATGN